MKPCKQSFQTLCGIVVILLILIAACSPKVNPATPTLVPLSPTIQPSLPSPTLAFTPFPPMPKETQIQFYDLLKNNGGCELPCFLGMTPSKTTWQDASSFLEAYARNIPLMPDRYASTATWKIYIADVITNYEVSLATTIQLEVDVNNLVQHIIFTADIKKDHITETHDKHLSWYSLSEIFKRYGSPDAIYVGYRDYALDYSIEAIYEKQKLVIQYGGLANLNANGSYTMCPNLGGGDISYMKLAMANPADPIDAKTLIGYPFWEKATSLEEASGMSVDEFYRLMTSDRQPACFQVKQP